MSSASLARVSSLTRAFSISSRCHSKETTRPINATYPAHHPARSSPLVPFRMSTPQETLTGPRRPYDAGLCMQVVSKWGTGRARPDEPLRKRRLNPAHRRRALELLASSPYGTTEKLLVVAHGFDVPTTKNTRLQSKGRFWHHLSERALKSQQPQGTSKLMTRVRFPFTRSNVFNGLEAFRCAEWTHSAGASG
jgi:hypothetical protein